VIQLFHVTKSFAGERPALAEVSLRVPRGEFHFLTGRSGAGKTTLLKLLFGSERVSRGQILVNGRNITRLNRRHIAGLRRLVGVVFQDFRLVDRLTAAENVGLAVRVMGASRAEARQRAERVLAYVGLQHKADALPPTLSGGEKQRVAIARALVNDPVLLLADEPTGNLDPEMSLEIMELFDRTNARGTTVVLATHDHLLLERFPHPLIRLEQGRLVSGGGLKDRGDRG